MLQTKLFIFLQRVLPQHLLSRIAGFLTNSKNETLKNLLIKAAQKKYKIKLDEALEQDPKAYTTFNEFFTRRLKSEARPIDLNNDSIVSPADGYVSQYDHIKYGNMIQAKGKHFKLKALLGDNAEVADELQNGKFITIYLAPKDYHRVHLPCDAELIEMTYIPGKLFSVNLDTANNIDNLFAINERVVCLFKTEFGTMAVVLVGAMLVASVVTEWHGVVAPSYNLGMKTWNYENCPIPYKKGADIGHFRFGSTVVVCLPEDCQFIDSIKAEQHIQMGNAIAQYKADDFENN